MDNAEVFNDGISENIAPTNVMDSDEVYNDDNYFADYNGNPDSNMNADGSIALGDFDDNDYSRKNINNDTTRIEMDNEEEQGEEDILPGVDDLPLFANPEARKIDLKIKDKEKKIEKVADEIDDMKNRFKVMKEHFKNVEQEVEHTNALLNAKSAESSTEKHLQQLTSRALGRSQLESRKIQGDIEETQDHLSNLQQSIYQATEKMEEFKMQMNWNQEELEQWAIAAKQKEDDSFALQKYTRADELKIKELSMLLGQLTNDCLQRRVKVENEATETQAKQAELDRIAIDFKKFHEERQQLVERWQETIEEMKRRDIEINDAGERYATAKAERQKKADLIVTQQKRLKAQLSENKEVDSRSEVLGRIVSNKRDEMVNGNKKLQEFRDELESLKNELTQAAESLVTKRNENANKSKGMEERRVMLERERQKYGQTKKKLEDAKNASVAAEDIAKVAEDDLEKTEKDASDQLFKLKILKENLFKESQTVFDLKKEEARLRAEIVGSRVTTRNMDTQLTNLDKEASRQQELLYNAEFQIQQIERKLARGMGERSDDEKRALRKQTEEAEARRDQAKEKRKMLQGQCRKLQNELVNARSRRDELTTMKIILIDKQAENELENRMLEDDIKKDVKIKEDVVIANDLLRLEVRRLRDLLSAKADVVFSLENRRQQLLLSMEERKQEISVHKDVLRAQLKTLNEEMHKITMDLREREANVEKLKARFEATPRGEDEGHSQAYYVIKAAQKREELQRKGDELDQDVRKCEREIRALQTTLDHLNARNVAYRNSFMKVDLKGEDAEILKQLEEKAKLSKDAVFRKKKDLQRLTTDQEEDLRRLEQLKLQASKVIKQRESLENARHQVEEEILTQQTQFEELGERSERLVLKTRSKVSESTGASIDTFSNGTLEEKAAKAEVLKDVVQNVLYTLGQLSNEFPEVSDQFYSLLKSADLRMPTNPPSRPSTSVQ